MLLKSTKLPYPSIKLPDRYTNTNILEIVPVHLSSLNLKEHRVVENKKKNQGELHGMYSLKKKKC